MNAVQTITGSGLTLQQLREATASLRVPVLKGLTVTPHVFAAIQADASFSGGPPDELMRVPVHVCYMQTRDAWAFYDVDLLWEYLFGTVTEMQLIERMETLKCKPL